MSTGPTYYVNSPVSGTQYWAPMGYGCIPNNASSVSCIVSCYTGSNGGGSLISETITAYRWDQTANASEGSFTQSGNTITSTGSGGTNGSDWFKPSGKYSGSGVGSLAMHLTYTGSAFIPTTPSMSPSSGIVGTQVTLTGTQFTDASSVTLGGVAASYTVNSDTSITVTVPGGTAGGTWTVGNQNGSATSASSFTVTNPSDSASGADSVLPSVTSPETDSASGADAMSLPAFAIPVTDSASGADTPNAGTVVIPIADSGAGATTISLPIITPAPTDAGSGLDTPTIFEFGPNLPDAGTGADSVTWDPTAPSQASVSDSASGAESVSFLNPAIFTLLDQQNAGENIVDGSLVFASVPMSDAATGGAELLFMGIAKAPQADSGVAAESLGALQVQIALTNPGVGAETPTLSVVSVALADAGSGADSAVGYVPISLADTATGTESAPIAASFAAPSDAATGSDGNTASFATISVPLTNTASGGDVVAIAIAITPPVDTASGGDSATLNVPLALGVFDYGTGQQLLTTTVTLAVPLDAASGLDVVTTAGIQTLVEAATGSDNVTLAQVSVPVGDLAAASDSSAVLFAFNIPASGAASDIQEMGAIGIALVDTASGTDTPALTLARVPVPDGGAGAESIGESSLAVSVADTGSGADAASIPVAPAVADTGSGVESLASLTVVLPLADAATAIESLLVTISAPRTDSARAQDIPSNLVMISLSDPATGAELQRATITLPLADGATGADTPAIQLPLSLADAGSGSEGVSAAVQVSVSDSASGAEVTGRGPLVVQARSVSDSAAATGELFTFNTIAAAIPESAAGSDLTALVVLPNTPTDGATGAVSVGSAATLTLLDSASGTELASFTLNPVAVPVDAGSGAEMVGVGNMFFIAVPVDTGAGADVAQLVPTSRAALTFLGGPGAGRAVLRGPGMVTYVIPVTNY